MWRETSHRTGYPYTADECRQPVWRQPSVLRRALWSGAIEPVSYTHLPIAQFKRNRCSISPVELILQSGVRIDIVLDKNILFSEMFVGDEDEITSIRFDLSTGRQTPFTLYGEYLSLIHI